MEKRIALMTLKIPIGTKVQEIVLHIRIDAWMKGGFVRGRLVRGVAILR